MKISAIILGAVVMAGSAFAADLSGKWIAQVSNQGPNPGEPRFFRVTLRVDGSSVTGTWGTSKVDGTLSGTKLDLHLAATEPGPAGTLSGALTNETGMAVAGPYSAAMTAEKFTGEGSLTGTGGGRGGRGGGGGGRGNAGPARISFTLTRASTPPAKPRDIKFQPKNYFATYSALTKPELSIFPGDVIHTSTADAGGVDAKGVQHRGGDSNIGPFYVEGALPGDTLVVHLLKVRTNRATAHQGTHINPHAITAGYLTSAEYDPAVDGDWTILPDKGIAVPTHPSAHMKNYSVPLKPMLGCISVAPQGDEQFRGTDLGPFGGNLDYNDNVEGTTLYFPVFHPGALLGMGDGHAAMGDGEVTNSALETSLDVDFSVEVIPGDASAQVRAETKDYLIAFGVSGSVPDSIQIATSQLATWIKKQYNLSDSEVAILFASTLKYDITELVDAKYNVVAKVPKTVLAGMK